jgi:hypothetical protein
LYSITCEWLPFPTSNLKNFPKPSPAKLVSEKIVPLSRKSSITTAGTRSGGLTNLSFRREGTNTKVYTLFEFFSDEIQKLKLND